MDGCWDDACCSFPAGPVAALTAGDGERRGWPPTWTVWATREARAARRSARALRASDMDVMVGEEQGGGRQIPAHPYLARQMSDFGFRQTLEVRTLGCARRFNPLPTCSSPNRKDLNYPTEQHKRHKVYTGSGHHCGVIPYSSVWCGGLPLGLMMNNTRKNSLTRVCSWLVLPGSDSWILDASTLGVASPIYRQRPWASSQILSGKGANNWPF